MKRLYGKGPDFVNPKRKEKSRNDSIAETVKEHRGRLSSVIRTMVRDSAEADDVLQEVFAEFVAAYDLGEVIETLGAWLVRVARNKVVDRFRRRKTQSDYQFLIQSGDEEEKVSAPEGEWLRERVRDALIIALESLPPEQREVFVMHELEGKSFETISAKTGVPVNTLLSRKRYAVRALREFLKEVHDELE